MSRQSTVNYWVTREKHKILTEHMEDSHVVNSIMNFWHRRQAICNRLAFEMMCYASDAPDMAADCAEREAEELMEAPEDHWIGALSPEREEQMWAVIAEARKRDLFKTLPEEVILSIEWQE